MALAGLTLSLHVLYHLDYSTHSVFARSPVSDARAYHETACKLAHGSLKAGSELTSLTIGYPLLLSAIYRRAGCRPEAARFLQLLVGVLLIGVLVALGWLLFGPAQGILAGALLTLYGPTLFFETKLLPTVWAAFVVLTGLLALEFARRGSGLMSWVAGLCFGLAAVLRPNLALLWVFVPLGSLFSWWRQREAGKTAKGVSSKAESRSRETGLLRRMLSIFFVGSLGVAMGVAPAAFVIKGATGHWHLFPATGGVTLLAGNHEGAEGLYDPPKGLKGDKAGQRAQAARLAAKLAPDRTTTKDPYRDSNILTWHVVRWMASHPGQVLKLCFLKAYRFMLSAEPRSAYSFRFEQSHIPSLSLAFVSWSFLLVFGILGMVVSWRRPEVVPLRALVAVVWATALIFFVSSRYRSLAAPPLALFSAEGLFWLFRRVRSPASLALVLGLVATSVFFSWDPFDQPRRLAAVDAFNRALAHRRIGDRKKALALLEKASSLSGGSAVYEVERGNLLLEMGRTEEARRVYRKVTRLHPDNADAWINLAILDWRAHRLSDAYEHLKRAVALRPADAVLRLNLARLAYRLGLPSEAREWAKSVLAGQVEAEVRHRAEILLEIFARQQSGRGADVRVKEKPSSR